VIPKVKEVSHDDAQPRAPIVLRYTSIGNLSPVDHERL
jgi:hypothetical protein